MPSAHVSDSTSADSAKESRLFPCSYLIGDPPNKAENYPIFLRRSIQVCDMNWPTFLDIVKKCPMPILFADANKIGSEAGLHCLTPLADM